MEEDFVNMNVTVKDEIRRLAKAKANLLGMTLEDYIAKLVSEDTHKQKLEVQE